MRFQRQWAAVWLLMLSTGLAPGCADPGPSGPTFEVSFDSTLAGSNGGEPARVELFILLDCESVVMGERFFPPPAPRAMVVRDGPSRPFGPDLRFGEFGLYGVAQDEDCAVVAAGCTPVTIDETTESLAITLSRFDAPGCAEDEFCALQTGRCEPGTGGAGGSGGSGGSGGAFGEGGTGGSSLTRVTEGLLALYDFDEGAGSTVFDQSGVSPPLDLNIEDTDNVTWSSGYLTTLDPGTKLQSADAATKLFSAIAPNNAITMEAWVRPSTLVATGTPPDRIVSMSNSSSNRNFLLGQDATEYAARYRTVSTDNNGNPTIRSTVATATLNLAHVVFTHAADGSEVFYIDGIENTTNVRPGHTTDPGDPSKGWQSTHPLVVGGETTSGREWLGELHLIAIYGRALSPEEVQQNFQAGP